MKIGGGTRTLLMFAVATLFVDIALSQQQCALPTVSTIETGLRELLISEGGEGIDVVPTVIDFHFTCLAIEARGLFRAVSVAVRYNTSNTGSVVFRAQVQFECQSGNFRTAPSNALEQNVNETVFSIITRRDCRTCTAATNIPNVDTDTNCLPCTDNCRSMGQGACNILSSVCCPFFLTDGTCTTRCPANFAASTRTNYTCVCNLTCNNGGTIDTTNCSCNCPPRFTGISCDILVDGCTPNPCLNGGTCNNNMTGFVCLCPPGFTGENCGINIDECDPNPCRNGGTCIDGVNSFTCRCQAGFTGTNCSIDIDECDPNPCRNGGICINGVNSFTCRCQAGFTGTNCSIDIDDCDPNPCRNGGTCIDGVNSFTCRCQAGFSGPNCTIDIDDCDPNPCLNGGSCIDQANGFRCMCVNRFTGTTCRDCEPGFYLQSGRCVENCTATCSGKMEKFDFDICRFVCLVRIWKQQAQKCNVALPNLNATIDTSLPELEQWKIAVMWWKQLRAAWAREAMRRGISVASTPNLGQPNINLWTSSLEQWRKDHRKWQQAATQLSPGFPLQDLSDLDFNFSETSPANELSAAYTTYVNHWTITSGNYQNRLASQCPA